jgi:histidinol-phosphate aminotransferase
MHCINGDLRSYNRAMRDRGILVGRPFPPMLSHSRVSIGLPNEMEQMAEALRACRREGLV